MSRPAANTGGLQIGAEFAVAWAHLIFNITVAVPFLLFLPLVERLLRERVLAGR